MIVRDLIKQLLDKPLDADVYIAVFTSERDGTRTEFDIEHVVASGAQGNYVAIMDKAD